MNVTKAVVLKKIRNNNIIVLLKNIWFLFVICFKIIFKVQLPYNMFIVKIYEPSENISIDFLKN